jgi:hypothetical protein
MHLEGALKTRFKAHFLVMKAVVLYSQWISTAWEYIWAYLSSKRALS